MTKKCTKTTYNARAQPLFYSLNLLFGGVSCRCCRGLLKLSIASVITVEQETEVLFGSNGKFIIFPPLVLSTRDVFEWEQEGT